MDYEFCFMFRDSKKKVQTFHIFLYKLWSKRFYLSHLTHVHNRIQFFDETKLWNNDIMLYNPKSLHKQLTTEGTINTNLQTLI